MSQPGEEETKTDQLGSPGTFSELSREKSSSGQKPNKEAAGRSTRRKRKT